MKQFLTGIGLFFIATIVAVIFIPVNILITPVVVFIVDGVDAALTELGTYFTAIAMTIDQMGNVTMKAALNAWFIQPNGYSFGNPQETMSSVLGKNELAGTLKKPGKILVNILNKFEPNHCIVNIEKTMYFFTDNNKL